MTVIVEERDEALAGVATWETEGEDRGRAGPTAEPHLLLLLMRGPAHGYDLLTRLAALGLRSGHTDQGTVYRALRRLEEAGCVISWWEAGASGPARRIYEITAQGHEALHRWSVTLRERKERLERFLDMYSSWTAQREARMVLPGSRRRAGGAV